MSSKKKVGGALDPKLCMKQSGYVWDVEREVLHLIHESTPECSEDWCITLGKASASIFCPLWQEICRDGPKQAKLNDKKTTGDINE